METGGMYQKLERERGLSTNQ